MNTRSKTKAKQQNMSEKQLEEEKEMKEFAAKYKINENYFPDVKDNYKQNIYNDEWELVNAIKFLNPYWGWGETMKGVFIHILIHILKYILIYILKYILKYIFIYIFIYMAI